MDIDAPLIPSSEEFFSVSCYVPGSGIVTYTFRDENSGIISPTMFAGDYSGVPILVPVIPSGTFVYTTTFVAYDHEIEAVPIPSGEDFFLPHIVELSISAEVISSSESFFYAPEVTVETSISTVVTGGEYFYTDTRLATSALIEHERFSSFTFYSPEIEQSAAIIDVPPFSNLMRILSPRVEAEKVHPIRFKSAATIRGGSITTDNLASLQDYIPVYNDSEYSNRLDFVYSQVNNLMSVYVPANEAVFSNTYYRAFYIKNDSTFDTRTDIDFWINGGETYTISNDTGRKIVNEGYHILQLEKSTYGVTDLDDNDIVLSGRDKTSLFGHLDISYMLADKLYEFDDDGVGVGVNLQLGRFTPGNVKTRIPRLEPGEYVGVYLRIRTKFNPDFPIPTDYAFFHLDYTSQSTGFREKYPGQLYNGNSNTQLLLPSISLMVRTQYEGINKYLKSEVDRFYNRYPPYFLHYEEK